MQSAQVVPPNSTQQNASSVDSKSPIHSFELRTSSTLQRCSRVTGHSETILPVGGRIVFAGRPAKRYKSLVTGNRCPLNDLA